MREGRKEGWREAEGKRDRKGCKVSMCVYVP